MKRARVGLFVMIDAVGGRYAQEREFLAHFEQKSSLRTVLGYSCSCQPTLLSGKLPREHGHGPMYRPRDGASALDSAKTYAWLPRRVADSWRVRNRIYAKVSQQVDGYFSLYECPTRLLPRFDLVEHRDIFQPKGLRQAESIFDRFVELKLEYSTFSWRTPEEENIASVQELLREKRNDVIFLYLPEVDGLLHAGGKSSAAVHERLGWYEDQILGLLELAEQNYSEVDLLVFSDHGMSDVHGSFDLKYEIESRFGQNGGQYLAFYDSTMARFWSEDEALRSQIADHLATRAGGRLIEAAESRDLGVDLANGDMGQILFVVDEGVLILPSYMGSALLAGMHGYHPDALDADACFFSPRRLEGPAEHIVDIFYHMDAIATRIAQESR